MMPISSFFLFLFFLFFSFFRRSAPAGGDGAYTILRKMKIALRIRTKIENQIKANLQTCCPHLTLKARQSCEQHAQPARMDEHAVGYILK